MPDLTDVERGLALAGQKASRALPFLTIAQAVDTASLRKAAANLGRVFAALNKDYRIGDWLVGPERTATGLRVHPWQLDGPTVKVYGNLDSNSRFQKYYSDCATVIPAVERAAITWALSTLGGQAKLLGTLRNEIASPGFANWMHEASKQISVSRALCQEAAKDEYRKTMRHPPNEKMFSDLAATNAYPRCTLSATDSFLQGEQVAKAADDRESTQKKYDYVSPWPQRAKYGELLLILRNLKKLPELVDAYSRSAAEGTNMARELITTATNGITEFSTSLTNHPGNVWRYPVLIIGGARELKLDGLEGFQDFALAAARIKGADLMQKFLNLVGVALLLFGLISGPGAGLIALDFTVGGVAGTFAYLREREKELAVNATSFLPDETKFAKDFGYGETALAVAFTLVAALGVVRGLRGSATPASARGVTSGATAAEEAAASARPRTLPSSEPLPPRGTPEKPAGTPETTATGTPESTATGTPAATATGTPEATATGTPATTATAPKSTATIDPKVAERIRPKIRRGGKEVPAPPAAKPEVKPTEPLNRGLPDEAGEKVLSPKAKSKPPSRATSQGQRAVPPKPMPPNTSDRFTDGVWTKKGKLNMNEGGMNFEGKSKKAIEMAPDEFEQGFNQQLGERLAKRVSNKPVRKDAPGMAGAETPSSGATNRLKFQATRRGGELRRRPEATMEVVENVPGQESIKSEVHFFEATVQSDFKDVEEWARTQIGHKQKQLTGTVWQSAEIPRKGFTENTKFYYHIFSPKPPSPTSITFLNKLANDYPNLEINWFVVQ